MKGAFMSDNRVVPVDQIESIIFLIRGQKVLLSPHLPGRTVQR